MDLIVLSPEQWANHSEAAHLICFDEIRPSSMDRIDYTIVIEKEGIPLVYATMREVDSETIYMSYGGSFPSAKGTTLTVACYQMVIDFLKSKYKHITTLVENTNIAMLKISMKAGLRIIGLRSFKSHIYLELALINEGT